MQDLGNLVTVSSDGESQVLFIAERIGTSK